MSDYSKCKMYIILDDDDNCYIGHTVQTLNARLCRHRDPSNKCSSKPLMANNPIIELLEEYPCKDRREAEHREQYWMDQFPNRVNSFNAIHDKKACNKAWELANKDIIREKHRRAVDRIHKKGPYTCECGKVITFYTQYNITRHEQTKKHINYNLSQLHKDEPNIS